MEREHPSVHQELNQGAVKKTPWFYNIVIAVAYLGAATQCVLIAKTILIDRDIAIAGLCLFFLVLFEGVFLLMAKKATSKLVLFGGIVVSVLTGLSCLLTLFLLNALPPVAFAGLFISLILALLLFAAPIIVLLLKRYEEK